MKPIPLSIPRFVEGVQYRRSGGGDWKWTTICETIVRFKSDVMANRFRLSCQDSRGNEWLRISRRELRIPAGYSWNGSSFSPDITGVMLASCVHDAIYQFSGCAGWPPELDRQWADGLFFQLTTTRLAWLYRAGLALGSWACWARPPKMGERVVRLSLHLLAISLSIIAASAMVSCSATTTTLPDGSTTTTRAPDPEFWAAAASAALRIHSEK